MSEERELDMDRIADLVSKAGVFAYVEQTGGGCATIYAGTLFKDEHDEERYPVAAGPGVFTGPNWTKPRGLVGDFYIGPDDDGETTTVIRCTEHDTEETIAALIVSMVKSA